MSIMLIRIFSRLRASLGIKVPKTIGMAKENMTNSLLPALMKEKGW